VPKSPLYQVRSHGGIRVHSPQNLCASQVVLHPENSIKTYNKIKNLVSLEMYFAPRNLKNLATGQRRCSGRIHPARAAVIALVATVKIPQQAGSPEGTCQHYCDEIKLFMK